MVERSLSMREALGSMPRFSSLFHYTCVLSFVSLAERSKAPDSSSGGVIRVGSNPTADNVISLPTELKSVLIAYVTV